MTPTFKLELARPSCSDKKFQPEKYSVSALT